MHSQVDPEYTPRQRALFKSAPLLLRFQSMTHTRFWLISARSSRLALWVSSAPLRTSSSSCSTKVGSGGLPIFAPGETMYRAALPNSRNSSSDIFRSASQSKSAN